MRPRPSTAPARAVPAPFDVRAGGVAWAIHGFAAATALTVAIASAAVGVVDARSSMLVLAGGAAVLAVLIVGRVARRRVQVSGDSLAVRNGIRTKIVSLDTIDEVRLVRVVGRPDLDVPFEPGRPYQRVVPFVRVGDRWTRLRAAQRWSTMGRLPDVLAELVACIEGRPADGDPPRG